MPNFEAKLKDEFQGRADAGARFNKPGESVPAADFEGLRNLGQTEFFPRRWEYMHRSHSLDDLTRPDYFGRGDIRDNLRVGDEIHFTLQNRMRLPSQWTRGIVVVEDKPTTREKPLIIAAVILYPAAKPCVPETDDKGKDAA